MTDTTHECPIDGCRKRVAHRKLMCLEHWRMVPRDLQHELYAAYDDRTADRARHIRAIHQCVLAVNNSRNGEHAASMRTPETLP